jgi:membrane associated rhomboid family serine protease
MEHEGTIRPRLLYPIDCADDPERAGRVAPGAAISIGLAASHRQMIPIGTDVRLRGTPVGNYVLIGINVLVFAAGSLIHPRVMDLILPPLHAAVPSLAEYITYQFRHGDLMHLAGNMIFLWIFGNPVCDRMGSLNYVLFYLAGGVCAGAVFAATNENPMLGASGAIAAVTAAFLVLYPRVHITLLIWFFIITTIRLPAMILIVFKIILWDNIISPGFNRGLYANVAHSAHLGGYAFGFLVALLMLAARALPRHQFDLLALLDRWRRRKGLGGDIGISVSRARPVPNHETGASEMAVAHPADELREDILDRLADQDYEEALQLYRRLRRLDPDQVLPRRQQLELANYLAQHQHQDDAVQAYEAFLKAYPGADDAAQVRLLLGLVCRRYLGDNRRAAEHLREALRGLSLESQRRLAADELQRAEAEISGPSGEPPLS